MVAAERTMKVDEAVAVEELALTALAEILAEAQARLLAAHPLFKVPLRAIV